MLEESYLLNWKNSKFELILKEVNQYQLYIIYSLVYGQRIYIIYNLTINNTYKYFYPRSLVEKNGRTFI